MSTTQRQWTFGAALIVGLAVPLGVIAPWLIDHGVDVPLLFDELFATGVSSFFAVDVILTVVTLLLLAASDTALPRASRISVAVGSLLGASVGLPLYLLLRERAVVQLSTLTKQRLDLVDHQIRSGDERVMTGGKFD